MKKYLVLPLVFALFFSGKPHPQRLAPKCGPTIYIDNTSSLTVIRVDVKLLNAGTTTTYTNPTFPITTGVYIDNYDVIYYFNNRVTGALSFYNSSTGDCSYTPLIGQPAVASVFNANCGDNIILDLTTDATKECLK